MDQELAFISNKAVIFPTVAPVVTLCYSPVQLSDIINGRAKTSHDGLYK